MMSRSNSYTIRLGGGDDLAHLPAIERAAAQMFCVTPYADLADDEDVLSAEIDLGRDFVWVAALGEQLVGFAIVHVHDTAVFLHEIDVHPDHARHGLGRRLIETIADWARERGAPAITLTTFADVPWNGPYYARLGFRELSLDELSPALQAVRQQEAAAGLPMATRICMQRDL